MGGITLYRSSRVRHCGHAACGELPGSRLLSTGTAPAGCSGPAGATSLDATNDERKGTVDLIGTRLGILCVALGLTMSACAAPDAAAPDLRTPPARETPSGTVGDLARHGAGQVGRSAPG